MTAGQRTIGKLARAARQACHRPFKCDAEYLIKRALTLLDESDVRRSRFASFGATLMTMQFDHATPFGTVGADAGL